MNGAVINVRVEPQIKIQAHDVAEELGLSLSGLVNAFLKQLVRTRAISFKVSEEPSDYLIETIKKSEDDIKTGNVTSFYSGEDALKYLDKLIAHDRRKKKN